MRKKIPNSSNGMHIQSISPTRRKYEPFDFSLSTISHEANILNINQLSFGDQLKLTKNETSSRNDSILPDLIDRNRYRVEVEEEEIRLPKMN